MKDLVGTLSPFIESSKKEEVIETFNEYQNNYIPLDGFATRILIDSFQKNALQLENVVPHFPFRIYKKLAGFVATNMNSNN